MFRLAHHCLAYHNRFPCAKLVNTKISPAQLKTPSRFCSVRRLPTNGYVCLTSQYHLRKVECTVYGKNTSHHLKKLLSSDDKRKRFVGAIVKALHLARLFYGVVEDNAIVIIRKYSELAQTLHTWAKNFDIVGIFFLPDNPPVWEGLTKNMC